MTAQTQDAVVVDRLADERQSQGDQRFVRDARSKQIERPVKCLRAGDRRSVCQNRRDRSVFRRLPIQQIPVNGMKGNYRGGSPRMAAPPG